MNNGTSAGPNGIVTFTIPIDAQYDTVDYYCTSHPNMSGTFNIMDYPGDNSGHGGNPPVIMFTGVSANLDSSGNLTVEFDALPTDVASINVFVSDVPGFDPLNSIPLKILIVLNFWVIRQIIMVI